MSEPDSPSKRERVLELLRRARLAGAPTAPEALEHSLRWLIRVAFPRQHASERLRERIRALGALRPSWLRWTAVRCLAYIRESCLCCDRRDRQPGPREEPRLSAPDREMLALFLAADPRRLPEDAALRREAGRVVRRLLALLPELQREPLMLRLGQDLSVPEIAAIMRRPDAEIDNLLRQARATIFGLVHEEFGEKPDDLTH